jgi:hypothetical protein
MLSNEKIAAIYELREAVENKVHAEAALDARPAAETRGALLEAMLDVEAKTQRAIEVCHACGYAHAEDERHDNVINVDFRRQNDHPGSSDPAS